MRPSGGCRCHFSARLRASDTHRRTFSTAVSLKSINDLTSFIHSPILSQFWQQLFSPPPPPPLPLGLFTSIQKSCCCCCFLNELKSITSCFGAFLLNICVSLVVHVVVYSNRSARRWARSCVSLFAAKDRDSGQRYAGAASAARRPVTLTYPRTMTSFRHYTGYVYTRHRRRRRRRLYTELASDNNNNNNNNNNIRI